MEQHFFDAKTGKEVGKKDSTGGLKARVEALENRFRQMMGVPKPTPTPKPSAPPMRQKKVLDKRLNPDTGEMALPGEPTVRYDGKIEKVMGEFKRGTLHSGSKRGPKVRNRKQAIAIGMSEARKAGERKYDGSKGSGPSYHYDATCYDANKKPITDPEHEAKESPGTEMMEHKLDRELSSYDGAVAGGPGIGGPTPLGVPVDIPQRTVGPHTHFPGVSGYTEVSEMGSQHEASTEPQLHK